MLARFEKCLNFASVCSLGELRDQSGIVAAGEIDRPGHIVEGGSGQQRDAYAGQFRLEPVEDVPIAFDVGVENALVEGAVAAVIHAEADRDDVRLIDEDIAVEAQVDRTYLYRLLRRHNL